MRLSKKSSDFQNTKTIFYFFFKLNSLPLVKKSFSSCESDQKGLNANSSFPYTAEWFRIFTHFNYLTIFGGRN